jgi:hypothetical protein
MVTLPGVEWGTCDDPSAQLLFGWGWSPYFQSHGSQRSKKQDNWLLINTGSHITERIKNVIIGAKWYIDTNVIKW